MARASEPSRGSTSALQRLAVGADVGTARPGTSGARRSTSTLEPASHGTALPHTAQAQQQQQYFKPLSKSMSTQSREQLSQLLQCSMASPLASALNASRNLNYGAGKRSPYTGGGAPPGSALSASALRSHSHQASAAPALQSSGSTTTSTSQRACELPRQSEILTHEAASSRGNHIAASLLGFSRPTSSAVPSHDSYARPGHRSGSLGPGGVASAGTTKSAADATTAPKLTVLPHRTVPYKPGTVLPLEQLDPKLRPGTSAGSAAAVRPMTANPITHTLSGPPQASTQAASNKADSSLGPGPRPRPGTGIGIRIGSGAAANGQLVQAPRAVATPLLLSRGGNPRSAMQPHSLSAALEAGTALPAPSLVPAAQAPRTTQEGQQAAGVGAMALGVSAEHSNTTALRDAPTSALGTRAAGLGDLHLASSSSPLPRPSSPLALATAGADTTGGARDRQRLGSPSAAAGSLAVQRQNAAPEEPYSPADFPCEAQPHACATTSRPTSGLSQYSTQALALGQGGDGAKGQAGRSRRGLGSVLEDDVDSVDLTLQRIRRENQQQDDATSINIVDDLQSLGGISELLLPPKGLGAKPKPKMPGGGGGRLQLRVPLPPPVQAGGPSGAVGDGVARAAGGGVSQLSRSLAAQAVPMVLSLEDYRHSTPEVLELELGRMSLEELMELDSKLTIVPRGRA